MISLVKRNSCSKALEIARNARDVLKEVTVLVMNIINQANA